MNSQATKAEEARNRAGEVYYQAREAYNTAREACNQTLEAYNHAQTTCDQALEACNHALEAYYQAGRSVLRGRGWPEVGHLWTLHGTG